MLAAADPERIRASFNEELEREARARDEELLAVILSRDADDRLTAKKRFYRRAVLDRRLLLWMVVRLRAQISGARETLDEAGRCVP